jgi:hypothetical protein
MLPVKVTQSGVSALMLTLVRISSATRGRTLERAVNITSDWVWQIRVGRILVDSPLPGWFGGVRDRVSSSDNAFGRGRITTQRS